MEEIMLIDKPFGYTSFEVIRRLRHIIGVKKIGHAGTLDPRATGLMVVGVGPGTKKLTSFLKLDKEYVAEILLGQKRSTGDMEGSVVSEKEVMATLSDEKIVATLATLLGELSLPVSAYSAIKVGGVPMYKRARTAAIRGEMVADVPPRAMRVDEAELLAAMPVTLNGKKFQLLKIRFAVGSGTYIRSLAEELGVRLGYPATLYNLCRTKVGNWGIQEAYTLDALEKIHS